MISIKAAERVAAIRTPTAAASEQLNKEHQEDPAGLSETAST